MKVNLHTVLQSLRDQGLFLDPPDKYNSLKRFPTIIPSDQVLNTKEYIFITKPYLNIFKDASGTVLHPDIARNSKMVGWSKTNLKALQQLQLNIKTHRSPFINLLCNTVANTVDIPSVTSKTLETTANMYGDKIFYRGNSFQSDQNVDFTLEFTDNHEIEVYSFFSAWDTYNNLKSGLGTVKPPWPNYIERRESHDKVNIFKIIVDEDNFNILFYAEFFGCYPTGVPRETFSELGDGGIKYSVPWHADFVEDNDPLILEDLNDVVSKYIHRNQTVSLYDIKSQKVITDWVNACPYAVFNRINKKFELEWRK